MCVFVWVSERARKRESEREKGKVIEREREREKGRVIDACSLILIPCATSRPRKVIGEFLV